jgi:hypothetical protein
MANTGVDPGIIQRGPGERHRHECSQHTRRRKRYPPDPPALPAGSRSGDFTNGCGSENGHCAQRSAGVTGLAARAIIPVALIR